MTRAVAIQQSQADDADLDRVDEVPGLGQDPVGALFAESGGLRAGGAEAETERVRDDDGHALANGRRSALRRRLGARDRLLDEGRRTGGREDPGREGKTDDERRGERQHPPERRPAEAPDPGPVVAGEERQDRQADDGREHAAPRERQEQPEGAGDEQPGPDPARPADEVRDGQEDQRDGEDGAQLVRRRQRPDPARLVDPVGEKRPVERTARVRVEHVR